MSADGGSVAAGSPADAPYLVLEPVPVLFCFGFLGVLAFLSITILPANRCGAGATRRRQG
jgi:hypothetical protein